MTQNNIPSVNALVQRIKNRLLQKQTYSIKANSRYRSPVKDLNDEEIAEIPVLTWDQNQAQNVQKRFHSKKQYQLQSHVDYQEEINEMKKSRSQKETIRNLTYCTTQRDIPRVPHRKTQGDTMKNLIYQAKYAAKPRVKPSPVNYDREYSQHQKRYYEIKCKPDYGGRSKSRSKIRSVVERDRLSGKKPSKFYQME